MSYDTMWETTVDLDTPCGYLSDVPATFRVIVDTYPAEPGPSGVSTKVVSEVDTHLLTVTIGELRLNRDQVMFMVSYPQVETMEKDYAEKYYEEVLTQE